jgi:hypothetical protein
MRTVDDGLTPLTVHALDTYLRLLVPTHTPWAPDFDLEADPGSENSAKT